MPSSEAVPLGLGVCRRSGALGGMLSLVARLLEWLRSLFWKEEMELTLVGLQYSGKTTLLTVLASGQFTEDMIPTVGFNMRKITKGNVTIKVWDIGGQPRFRSMWERYCRGVNAVVYMVDAADLEKVEASKNELHSLIDKPQLHGIPVLVLGNKRDLPGALDEKQLIEKLVDGLLHVQFAYLFLDLSLFHQGYNFLSPDLPLVSVAWDMKANLASKDSIFMSCVNRRFVGVDITSVQIDWNQAVFQAITVTLANKGCVMVTATKYRGKLGFEMEDDANSISNSSTFQEKWILEVNNDGLSVVCGFVVPGMNLKMPDRRQTDDRIQEVFGQYSQAHDVTLGDGPVQGQELDLIFVGPFQLGIFLDYVSPDLQILSSSLLQLDSKTHKFTCDPDLVLEGSLAVPVLQHVLSQLKRYPNLSVTPAPDQPGPWLDTSIVLQ
ncbi:hypothetical protein BTVI_70350 [Pitangus sulphuratus]|nr:hypothetical protein BTVI_70350 [Pitangus sulphuratus]